jgi:putative transposase
MSRAGNVWDNAVESFFSSLKSERTARKNYRTRKAKADVFGYIADLQHNPTSFDNQIRQPH